MKNKTLIAILILISFLVNGLKAQLMVEENLLSTKDGKLYFKNDPFTGTALNYYQNGQIKSKMAITAGKKTGIVEEYFESKDFKLANYRDTALISKSNAQISVNQEKLKKNVSDSIDLSKQLMDFINYKFGGEKKYLKMAEKNNDGKLNKNDKELFDQYVALENSMKLLIANNKNALKELQALNEKITNEQNKPGFQPKKSLEYELVDGIKNGPYKKYNENGIIMEEGSFNNGKYSGDWVFRFPSGNMHGKGRFINGDGSDIGSSGIPKNGRDGQWLVYHENGKLSLECNYVKGLLEGPLKSFHDNGNPQLDLNYTNGKKNGNDREFYKNGVVFWECNMENDQKKGTYKEYYESGKLKVESTYVKDYLEGIAKTFHENGQVKGVFTYKRDNEHGPFKLYFESGKLQMVGAYDSTSQVEGKLIGDITMYKEDGTIESKIYFNKDGSYVDKTPKSELTLSKVELDKTYRCKCCKSTINGIYDGVDSNGENADQISVKLSYQMYNNPSTKNSFASVGKAYSTPYEMIRQEYKFCSMKCSRACYNY